MPTLKDWLRGLDTKPAGTQSASWSTGKAADSGYTTEKKSAAQAANRETLAAAFGLSSSGNSTAKNTFSTLGAHLPTMRTGTKDTFGSGSFGTSKPITGKAADAGLQTSVQRTSVVPTVTVGKAADSGITRDLRRIQQQANRQTVNNLFQGSKNTNKLGDYSLAKGAAGALQKGLQKTAEMAGNTLAFAEDIAMAPFELTSGLKLGDLSDNAPLNRWAQKIREEGDAVNQYYAENVKAGGKGAEIFDQLGSSLIAAVPQAAAAVFSGGTSTLASTAGLQAQAASALSPGLTTTIRNVVGKMAQNPQYWLSFSQSVGNSYENAIADIETKNAVMQRNGGQAMDSNNIRTKAALQAVGSGLMSAAIEMSGGLQKLPEELRHGEGVWKALVDSGVDEGKENVYQGIIDRASQNLFYDKRNPLVSLTNPNAVFSLPTVANEFAEGFAVGSILGGGQAGIISTAQAMRGNPVASYGVLNSPAGVSYAEVLQQQQAAQDMAAPYSEYARYRELERKFLDGSILAEDADELWRLENIWGQFDASNKSVDSDAKTLRQLNAADAFNDYQLAEKMKEGYTQSKHGASKFREFDSDGTPLFAKSKEDAGVQPVNFVEDKKMRERAKEKFGLENDEASRLKHYVDGMLCYRLNMKMTKGIPLTYGEKEIAQSIRNAFLKFPSYSGCTYRTIQCRTREEYDAFLSEYSEGSTVTWNGFTSTSKRPNGYPLFGNYVIHMVVDGVSGRDIADTYGIPRQQEVTYLPGVRMDIIKITRANDGCPLIYLEEVKENDNS